MGLVVLYNTEFVSSFGNKRSGSVSPRPGFVIVTFIRLRVNLKPKQRFYKGMVKFERFTEAPILGLK